MASATHTLTVEEFEALSARSDQEYEFWYGEAIAKAMPAGIHALLQMILGRLLHEAGFAVAGDVELRIEPNARLRPDLIATRGKIPLGYPAEAVEVAVEILAEDDSYAYLREKCRKYQEWGFEQIYVVSPDDRTVLEWKDGAHLPAFQLAGVPVERIWDELDRDSTRSVK